LAGFPIMSQMGVSKKGEGTDQAKFLPKRFDILPHKGRKGVASPALDGPVHCKSNEQNPTGQQPFFFSIHGGSLKRFLFKELRLCRPVAE
jgi:hypothetical protein